MQTETAVKSRNPNHPKKGSSTKVAPIRDLKAVKRIKKILEDSPRDYCLFVLGVNTAFRINEILSLRVKQVDYLRPGDILEVKQSKTGKHRRVKVNTEVVEAIDKWLGAYRPESGDAPLFPSKKGGNALTVPTAINMVKTWCANVGLRGQYGSHTLRKTWGYHQRVTFKEDTAVISQALGHVSDVQTREYLGIEISEVSGLYDNRI